MERLTNNQDDELLNYLDGKLSDVKVRELKSKLETSSLLSQRLEELRAVHQLLAKEAKLETPSSNFTHRVMSNLHRVPVMNPLSPKNGLLLLCGTMVAIGILVLVVSSGFFDSMTHSINVNELPVKQEYITTNIAFNSKWVINGLILLNIVLAFILLDRTILRPFFNRRANAF